MTTATAITATVTYDSDVIDYYCPECQVAQGTEYGHCPDCGEELLPDYDSSAEYDEAFCFNEAVSDFLQENYPKANLVVVGTKQFGWRRVPCYKVFDLDKFIENAVSAFALNDSFRLNATLNHGTGAMTVRLSHHDSPTVDVFTVLPLAVPERGQSWGAWRAGYLDFPNSKKIEAAIKQVMGE